MSIAGIAKEATTIAAAAIVFGDELTPLNITGVGITIAGKSFWLQATVADEGIDSCVPFRYRLVYLPQISQINRLASAARW
jgi:hypothetical protein